MWIQNIGSIRVPPGFVFSVVFNSGMEHRQNVTFSKRKLPISGRKSAQIRDRLGRSASPVYEESEYGHGDAQNPPEVAKTHTKRSKIRKSRKSRQLPRSLLISVLGANSNDEPRHKRPLGSTKRTRWSTHKENRLGAIGAFSAPTRDPPRY